MPDHLRAPSEIDLAHAVPGDERAALAAQLAHELVGSGEPSFGTSAWSQLHQLDGRSGLGTRPAVRVVLRRPSDGRFLLFRYRFRDGTRRWIIPGGGAEAGETPFGAAVREVREETGTEPRDLRASGLVLYHLVASRLYGDPRPAMVQYSPVLTGEIDDELPDCADRDPHWFTIDEFKVAPRRPISTPLIAVLRASELGQRVEPQAVWLPA
ncbi:MAG: NUDIX hydrolase [Thermoleophilia bacterium]|nr:NUDIX hydrolase [Thermoleophilia bacterium]